MAPHILIVEDHFPLRLALKTAAALDDADPVSAGLREKLKTVFVCAWCHQEAPAKQCGHCHTVYYCNRSCQRSDWKRGEHRKTCKQLQK